MSAVAMIVGIAFIGIGVFAVIPNFGAIGVLWTLISVGITGYHGFNLFSATGVAHEVVDFDASPSSASRSGASNEPSLRLAQLDALKDSGTITETEYREQRARILKEI